MTEPNRPAPEIKAAGEGPTSLDVVNAFDEFMSAFDAFKEANDQRLEEIEARITSDVVTEEKVARINRAMDEHKRALDRLTLKGSRPHLGAGKGPLLLEASEHKSAFDAYFRTGDMAGLKTLEAKALSAGSDPDGGYLVPEETEAEIGRRLAAVSPIRAIAGIRQVSSNSYKKPFSVTGPVVGWAGETDPRPETASPTLVELVYPVMELYAMPAATPSLLDDAAVDVDAWIAGEVDTAFAEQEGSAFVAGDGVNKPRGFLDYPTVDETAWAWGSLGYLPTGTAGGFSASASDILVDAVYALKAGYRQSAHWVMNRQTQAEIRKIKDADGNYIWAPPATADARATIMNFPITEAEDMPNIATDSLSIAFGDFSRGYLIVDRQGIRVLRDPYSQKPYVLFYTTKRVGGGVQDFDALKLIKFGTV